MITTRYGTYDGDTWEEHCQVLLKLKYDDDGFQEMPAHTKGDLGIEGFTRSGIVFQCYCPDEEYETETLYKKQRDKITADLGKLKKYKKELKRYLGEVKIRQWIFLTPLITNKELVAHCQSKAIEYRKMFDMTDLLQPDFDILVKDEPFFVPELAIVKQVLNNKLQINVEATADTEIINWKECNSEFIINLFRKIGVLYKDHPNKDELINRHVDIMIRALIKGTKLIDRLNQAYPPLYEKQARIKSHIEGSLAREKMHAFLVETTPGDQLFGTLDKYRQALVEENFDKVFEYGIVDDLRDEAIADWLARCPLDFGGI